MSKEKLYGGIEAGGTKFVCVVARGPGQVVDEIRFTTTTPEETLGSRLWIGGFASRPIFFPRK